MAARPPEVVDGSGRPVKLGAVLGQGGEGAVYDIPSAPDLVAKVYHKPLSGDRAEKVRVMGGLRTDLLGRLTAWPVDLLRDRAGAPVGLLMPRVNGRKDVHNLYSPKSRRSEFQRADWRFLVRAAANTARAFAAVHDAGCVIGDVNHGGVLVGQDATVTLIDCDSFQVAAGGRRFLCEVGVETFTPPELQGKPFQGVVRNANHDDFGLAVMVFLLLFMGRHPFSGRYAGPGDMPIAKAIEEVRFAYGARRAAAQMMQPPGTPPLQMVGPEVARLFEAAFARENLAGGRPTARDWIGALAGLEQQLKQCAVNPSHWHHRDISCPWCPMEGATGVPLFPAIVHATAGTAFDLSVLWKQVEAIPHPGPAPDVEGAAPPPSDKARRLSGWKATRYAVAGTIGGLLVLLTPIVGPLMLLAGGAAFLVMLAVLNRSKDVDPFRDAQMLAEMKWRQVQAEWERRAGPGAFDEKQASLARLRDEWNQVPQLRAAKLQELHRDRERVQRERFLDAFEIEKAKIEGIGKGRKQTLASYGIETAADVTGGRILQVPGFGPKMQRRLFDWRATCERRFVFDPARAVDPRDTARVEQDVLMRKKGIEGAINAGVAELRTVRAQVDAARQHMRPQVEAARRELLQAEADYRAVR